MEIKFGSYLYEVIANVASTALEEIIDVDTVRFSLPKLSYI